MSVQRYRRKPQQARDDDGPVVARYEPGQPFGDLREVAQMADSRAEVCEVTFGSGKRVLLAWHMHIPDAHLPEPDYTVVEPGGYLAFSRSGWHLYATDDADLRHFYDLVTEVPGE